MAKNFFNSVKVQKPKRNKFNLSHDVKGTMQLGRLTPIFCQDILPNDTFRINTAQMMRMAPMLAPIMHKVDVYTHFFFVPSRILWEGSENFFTGGEDGNQFPEYPTVDLTTKSVDSNTIGLYLYEDSLEKPWNFKSEPCPNGFEYDNTTGEYHPHRYQGLIADYLGLPNIEMPVGLGTDKAKRMRVSALPFAAYGMIWNEYFRDQNLQPKLDVKLSDGDNSFLLYKAGLIGPTSVPFKRAWRHDYFTSNLPFAQKGPAVSLPVTGEDIPINFENTGNQDEWTNSLTGDPIFKQNTAGNIIYSNDSTSGNGQGLYQQNPNDAGVRIPMNVNNSKNLFVNLTGKINSTINDLRTAYSVQRWLELNARAGSRYSEFVKAHFGVQSPDARLQRPEYLGGSKSPLVVSEIVQTSSSTELDSIGESPLGNFAGHGINMGGSKGFKYFATEHGFIIGLMSVVPRGDYFQGIPRRFSKFSRFDHYYPSFAHLGEQATLNKELYYEGDEDSSGKIDPIEDETFGYLPRYAEYRFASNTIHGEMRSSLDFWHLGRKFDIRPKLNSEFIMCNPSTRIFAVESSEWEKLYYHVQITCTALRPLPYYGTPML